MQFNPSTAAQSIVSRMDRICQSNSTTYPLINKANDCNDALDRYWFLAMMASGDWEIDDKNNTDLSIAVTNLVSGQQDYSLATEHMTIEKVLVKDSSGNWRELTPVDIRNSRSSLAARNIVELPTGNAGIPTHYDKYGQSLFLDAIPNYSSTGGIKIYYGRGSSYFVSTDITKEPGIPTIFHGYIARRASLTYLIDKELNDRAKNVAQLVSQDEEAITEFYSKRSADVPTRMRTIYRSSR